MGEYYRYEFLRPLFPDYPRPAVWPDGYYVPSSTSDDFIQKHACVADRQRMLKGEPATEQCVVIDGVNIRATTARCGTSATITRKTRRTTRRRLADSGCPAVQCAPQGQINREAVKVNQCFTVSSATS